MSTESPARPKKSWLKRIGITTGVIVLLILASGLISVEIPFGFLFLFIYLLSGLLPVIGLCLIGWIFFLGRVGREIQFDVWSVSLGLGAFVALVYGVQRAIHRYVPNRRWTVWQTFRCVVGVIAMFATGICLLGVGHEISWLFRSQRPPLITIDTWHPSVYGRMTQQNLRQIGGAVNAYADKSQSPLVGGTFQDDGAAGHGWMTALLPYLYHQPIYDEIDFAQPWYAKVNHLPFSQRVREYESIRLKYSQSSNPDGYATSSYAANDRLLNANRGTKLGEIADGAANTIFAGEVKQKLRPWGDAANWRDLGLGINQSPDGFGSDDQQVDTIYMFEIPSENELRKKIRGGATFLMADGTVRFINETIDPKVLHALATPNANDQVDDSSLSDRRD